MLVLGAGLAWIGAVRLHGGYRAVTVADHSMSTTLEPGDKVLFHTVVGTPHRGDVVLVNPRSWPRESANSSLVRRVIGLPGDTVACCDDHDRIVVDSQPVTEEYLHPDPTVPAGTPYQPFHTTVATGTVFLAGDDRADSMDSRFVGTLPESDVLGIAVTGWPIPKSFVSLPATTAFVHAGLHGVPTQDDKYLWDLWAIVAGAVLTPVGLCWLLGVGIRAMVRGRR